MLNQHITNYMLELYKKSSKNFMTPRVLKYEVVDNRIIELSEGECLEHKPIYGVSEFIFEDESLTSTHRGNMHRSKSSATKHYKVLMQSPDFTGWNDDIHVVTRK